MKTSPHDNWLFLLSLTAIPACGDDATSAATSGSTTAVDDTTGTAVDSSTSSRTSGASTTDAVPGSSGVDSSGDPPPGGTTTGTGTGPGTDSTTSSTDATDAGTTGSASVCEQWALSAQTGCAYPGGLVYLEEVCEGYVANASAQCQLEILALLTCEANQGGPCDPSCQSESDDSEACEDAVQAKALGCAMIPMVAATGTIPAQCEAVTAQAFACDAEGYYISFFSPYVNYPPGTAQPYCEAAFPWLLDTTPLSDISPECGGAYEELLTCLSGLDCVELDDAITNGLSCTSEIDALICRCALGA